MIKGMDELRLYDLIKWLVTYSRENIINICPKIHSSLKNEFWDNLLSLHENCIRANINEKTIRRKFQKDMEVNIYLLDYYIEEFKRLKIIKAKQYNVFISKLEVIMRMTQKWYVSNEKSE